MTVFTFKHYSFLSILLAGGAIINSYTIHEQFYPSIIYLTNQKSNKLIMLNFFFMLGLAFFKTIMSFFFGEIREIEKLSILDSLKRKIFDIVFIILIYKEDNFDSSFYSWLIVLGFIWIIHQATIKRSEYLVAESITDTKMHMKLTIIYISLICLNSCVLRYMIKMYTNFSIDSYLVLFFLEYLLISLNIIFPAIKYFTLAFEMFTYSHFQNKNNIFMVLEFVLTVSKLCIQLYMRIKYMLLFPFIVDLIENFVQLYNTIQKFTSSIKLLRLLNKLPDVDLDEIEEVDNTCLICLSEIKHGKKIGCGHFFHKNCLKELIQGKTNQLCPKCRSPINIEQAIKDHEIEALNNKKKPQTINKLNVINSQKNSEEIKDNKNQEQQADNKQFQFVAAEQKLISSVEELLQNIGKLLKTEINQPKIIQKVKWLIYDIVGLEDALKTDEQKQLKDDDSNLEKIFNFSLLLSNTQTDLKKCGAISYGLPKIASYNRTFADECLRKKIELMNLLLLNCQRDMLLQTMFFGATKNLTKNENTNETNQKQESQEEEEKKVSNETLLKPQDKQNLGDSSIFDSAAKSSKENILSSKNNQAIEEPSIFQKNDSKVDPKDEERERKLAWIEKLQSQISQTVEQQSNQKQESQQEQQQIDNNQTQQETSNDNQ